MAEDPYMPRRAEPKLVMAPNSPPGLMQPAQVLLPTPFDQTPTGKIRDLVLASIEKGIAAVLNDIDNLIKELVEMKAKVVDDAGLCKDVVANHFNVQAGAIDHVEEIRRNMQHLANGGQPKPPNDPKT